MSDLYLIAHKVRGEPAFDVAEPMKFGEEDGWIIPTSGHRACPFWHCKLNFLLPVMPPDLPDHYPCNEKPKSKVTQINLEELDL